MEYEQKELNHASVIIKGLLLKEGISKAGNSFSLIEVHTDQDTYTVWLKKNDGTERKAFTQLKTFGFPLNKRTGVAFDIKDKSYVNQHTGKKVESKERTIMYFEELQGEHQQGQPERQEEAEMPSEPITNEPHDEIDVSQIPF